MCSLWLLLLLLLHTCEGILLGLLQHMLVQEDGERLAGIEVGLEELPKLTKVLCTYRRGTLG